MKKTYVVQLIIDIMMIIFGVCLFIYPGVRSINSNQVFYTTMGIYAFLELCEFVFDRTRGEPLYIFFTAGAAAFAGYFLRQFPICYVLAGTIAVWTLAITIIKINSLEEINLKKKYLFLIKLTSMSIFAMLGILVSINLYYRVSTLVYMLALLYMCYGAFELGTDFVTYLSKNN